MMDFIKMVWEYRREVYFLSIFIISTSILLTRAIRNQYRRKKYQLPYFLPGMFSLTSGFGGLIIAFVRLAISI